MLYKYIQFAFELSRVVQLQPKLNLTWGFQAQAQSVDKKLLTKLDLLASLVRPIQVTPLIIFIKRLLFYYF